MSSLRYSNFEVLSDLWDSNQRRKWRRIKAGLSGVVTVPVRGAVDAYNFIFEHEETYILYQAVLVLSLGLIAVAKVFYSDSVSRVVFGSEEKKEAGKGVAGEADEKKLKESEDVLKKKAKEAEDALKKAKESEEVFKKKAKEAEDVVKKAKQGEEELKKKAKEAEDALKSMKHAEDALKKKAKEEADVKEKELRKAKADLEKAEKDLKKKEEQLSKAEEKAKKSSPPSSSGDNKGQEGQGGLREEVERAKEVKQRLEAEVKKKEEDSKKSVVNAEAAVKRSSNTQGYTFSATLQKLLDEKKQKGKVANSKEENVGDGKGLSVVNEDAGAAVKKSSGVGNPSKVDSSGKNKLQIKQGKPQNTAGKVYLTKDEYDNLMGKLTKSKSKLVHEDLNGDHYVNRRAINLRTDVLKILNWPEDKWPLNTKPTTSF